MLAVVRNNFGRFPRAVTVLAGLVILLGPSCGGGGGGGGGIPGIPGPNIVAMDATPANAMGLVGVFAVVGGTLNTAPMAPANADLAFLFTGMPLFPIGTLINTAPGFGAAAIAAPAPFDGAAPTPCQIDNVVGIALGDMDIQFTGLDLVVTLDRISDGTGCMPVVPVLGSHAVIYPNAGIGDFSGGSLGDMQDLDALPAGSIAPRSLTVGDFDGDGDDWDIVVGHAGILDVAGSLGDLLRGIGDGTGALAGSVSALVGIATSTVSDAASGFFDATMMSDFAVVNAEGLFVYLNNVAPGMPIAIAERANAVKAVDVDGDGDVDLVVGTQGVGVVPRVYVYLGDGTGTFVPSPQTTLLMGIPVGAIGQNVIDVELGNFDGMGNPDVAVLLDSNAIRIMNNDLLGVAGAFDPTTTVNGAFTLPLAVGGGATDMTTVNFDQAGFDDIAVAEPGLGQIQIFTIL